MKKRWTLRYICHTLVVVVLIVVLIAVASKEILAVRITIKEVILGIIFTIGIGGAVTVLLLGIVQDIKFWKMIDHNQEKLGEFPWKKN